MSGTTRQIMVRLQAAEWALPLRGGKTQLSHRRRAPNRYGSGMDWEAVGAGTGAIAAGAAAWQLWRLRVDQLDARAAEIDSVSVATLVSARPTQGDVHNGYADWVLEYTIHNPGRLPISGVNAVITFPCEVQRRHYDGSLDDPSHQLSIRVPTIPPHSSHPPRTRRLSIAESDRATLDQATVRIDFHTPDAGFCTNDSPPAPRKGVRALRRRLTKDRPLHKVAHRF